MRLSGFRHTEPPSGNGSNLKGKNLLPWEANSFLIEKTSFQKGGKTFLKVTSPESVSTFSNQNLFFCSVLFRFLLCSVLFNREPNLVRLFL